MLLEKKYILENLERVKCYKCGSSMEQAKLVPINEGPMALIAHAVCPICKAESMVTITPTGNGIMPLQSDLTGKEYEKFLGQQAVSYDELLELHLALKKDNLWNLLQKKEKNSGKTQKA